MQRRKLERHLLQHGYRLVREGAKHDVYISVATNVMATPPRHTEIDPFLARKICKELGIPAPSGK